MRRFFYLVITVLSIFLCYFSVTTFSGLVKFQQMVADLNRDDQAASASLSGPDGSVAGARTDFKPLQWDADVNYILATATNNLANQSSNKAQRQELLGDAQELYLKALSLRPRDINLLVAQLLLLIDQGAPLDFALSKLDRIITLVPKDQDLKAELSMICFKLLGLHTDESAKNAIADRLKKLFVYSMDYRGTTQVIRYARLYGQQQVLDQVLAEIN